MTSVREKQKVLLILVNMTILFYQRGEDIIVFELDLGEMYVSI